MWNVSAIHLFWDEYAEKFSLIIKLGVFTEIPRRNGQASSQWAMNEYVVAELLHRCSAIYLHQACRRIG